MDSRHDLIAIDDVIKTRTTSPPINHGVIVPGNVPAKLQTLFPKDDKNIGAHYNKRQGDGKSLPRSKQNVTKMPPLVSLYGPVLIFL